MKNVAMLALCSILAGCVESKFELAPESRIPGWFTLRDGVTRGDVTVTLTYYTTSPAQFKLLDRVGRTLASVEAEPCRHPDTLRKRNASGGYDEDSYPHYVYFKVNGVLELIEHQHEPRFRISDDPELRRIAAEFPQCLT